MHRRHLVVRKQALYATPVRDRNAACVRVSNNSRLENTGDSMANAEVERGVAEEARAPLDEGLHDVHLSGERKDGDLLRAEVHDGQAVVGPADVPPQAVHRADGRVALHHGQRETADGDRSADDAPHRLCERDAGRGRLLGRAEDGLGPQAHVVEGRDGVVDRVGPATLGKKSACPSEH